MPYGDAQIAACPAEIGEINGEINADPDVDRVSHLAEHQRTARVAATTRTSRPPPRRFERFADPLVYTPGDNDCHRASNGAYLPSERLGKLRELFSAKPGHTVGGHARVRAQSRAFPENVMWETAACSTGWRTSSDQR